MKHEEKQFLLDVAKLSAARSSGIRLKVGAVVSDAIGNLIAAGYNGSIRGGDNCLEYRVYPKDDGDSVNDQTYPYYDDTIDKPYRLVTKTSTIHAEQNVIAHAARRGISVMDGAMFLTHSPCSHCTALMIQSGIKEVIFLEEHRSYSEVVAVYGNHVKFTKWVSNNA
jgi:dCMP deaminase